MARGSGKLIQLAIVGAGGLYVVEAGRAGQLPEFLQSFLHTLAPSTFPSVPGVGGGGGGGGGGTCNYTQIPGVRFVTQDAVGWYTYYNGSVYRANSQSEAEQKYNALVAASCR